MPKRKNYQIPPLSDILSLNPLSEKFLQFLLYSERDIFLENNPQESANGFYKRVLLNNSFGSVQIDVPRVMSSSVRSKKFLPPPWKRTLDEREKIIGQMLLSGATKAQISYTLRNLSLGYSQEEVNNISERLC